MHFIYVVISAAYWQTYYDLHQPWFVQQLGQYLLTGLLAPLLTPAVSLFAWIFEWLLVLVASLMPKNVLKSILEWLGLTPPPAQGD